jgi:hypothetical protein
MIPTASLVTACSSRPFVQGFPSEFPRVDVIARFRRIFRFGPAKRWA